MHKRQQLQAYVDQLSPTWFGKFMYYCFPFRKKIVLQNMRLVFNDALSTKDITKLAKSFYSHFVTAIRENLLLRFMSTQQICNKVQVRGHEQVLNAVNQGKGVLILTGHFGNWEFAPIGGILNFKQFKRQFHFVRRTLKYKFIEKILFHRYYKAGLQVIPKKNSLFKICDALEKNNAVVFILDQHASIRRKDGMLVEFFGKKAGTHCSLAMIARHLEVPVIPATSYRTKSGKHVLQFFEPLPWITAATKAQEIADNTLAYNHALERMLLAHPEQWLWMHKRWKYK